MWKHLPGVRRQQVTPPYRLRRLYIFPAALAPAVLNGPDVRHAGGASWAASSGLLCLRRRLPMKFSMLPSYAACA